MSTNLHRRPSPVKARIVGAGIRLGQLAGATGLSRASISLYLAGRRRAAGRQRDIWMAYRSLAVDHRTGIDEFWGELLTVEDDR